MRSTSDLTTRRLSLRLRQEGRCSSKMQIPTIIGSLQGRRYLFAGEGLDDVARLEVLEPLQADAAVEAGAHLGGVVLEAPQGGDLPFVDDTVVAQQADRGAPRDHAVEDVTAGDRPDARH